MCCCSSGKFHWAAEWWLGHANTLYLCVTRPLIIFSVFFPSFNWTYHGFAEQVLGFVVFFITYRIFDCTLARGGTILGLARGTKR